MGTEKHGVWGFLLNNVYLLLNIVNGDWLIVNRDIEVTKQLINKLSVNGYLLLVNRIASKLCPINR